MARRIVILGAGESGVGAALLAKKKGFEVFVSDSGEIKDKYKSVLSKHEISFEEKKHSEEKVLNAHEIIKSPGIPDTVALVEKAVRKGISVISEIEFGFRYTDAGIVGVTGSNGKTTTTLLIHHILKRAGFEVGLGGNIGESFAKQVAEIDCDWYVLELSSFQLDGIERFKPDIAVLLNITEDHLDRYEGSMEKYIASKFRITKNQKAEDKLIYGLDDENIRNEIEKRTNKIKAKKIAFSQHEKLEEGAFTGSGKLIVNLNNKPFAMSIHELALQGRHNLYNSMAASVAARILDIRKDVIRESLSDFQNVEHRLETVGLVHGIEFINDSKATNVNSTWFALETVPRPIIWVAGGVDKGNDYKALKELVGEKVKAIICLGKNNEKIHAAFKNVVEDIDDALSADEAVRKAYSMGEKGDTVLLSPACASFDLFESYEDRGYQFKRAVRML